MDAISDDDVVTDVSFTIDVGIVSNLDTIVQVSVIINFGVVYQLPPTEVGGLFLSSVVERLKADSLPKDSVL